MGLELGDRQTDRELLTNAISFQGTHLCDSCDCVTSFSLQPPNLPQRLTSAFLELVPPAALWSWESKKKPNESRDLSRKLIRTHHSIVTKTEEKIHGYERKGVLQYVLVKQLQVLYGNCLFKYPNETGRHC